MTDSAIPDGTSRRLASRVGDILARGQGTAWGWLGELSLLSAAGLYLVVVAYNSARLGSSSTATLRWIGLFILCVPITFRLFSRSATRRERIGLVLVIGLGLYLVRVLYSPLEFRFADELQHWKTIHDILQSGHLFKYNYILPISPYYPGLESATSAVISLSGLSIFTSSVMMMGLARITFVLALYLLYERLSGSARIAGIASLLYMTNPHYQSFAAMYIYQSLALPLSALVLLAAVQLPSMRHDSQVALKVALLAALLSIIVTHHLTSYILLIFMVLWTLTDIFFLPLTRFINRILVAANHARLIGPLVRWLLPWENAAQPASRARPGSGPVWRTLIALVVMLSWITYVAPLTIRYLGDPVSEAGTELIRLITAKASVGQMYSAPSGPVLEKLIGLASVGLICLWLPLGMWHLWRRGHKDNPLLIAIALGSLGYYGSIALRLTSGGAELTARAWPFIFVVVALALGVGMVDTKEPRRWPWIPTLLFSACTVVLLAAGVTAGWPPAWGRLPGAHMVGASERSVSPEGVEAAKWVGKSLTPGNRLAGDFTNHTLMGAYGGQDSVFGLGAVFFASEYGAAEQEALRYQGIKYLVVDMRLSKSLPTMGTYFDSTEPEANRHTTPIDPAALTKFDGFPGINRFFDSGNIAIYEVDNTW